MKAKLHRAREGMLWGNSTTRKKDAFCSGVESIDLGASGPLQKGFLNLMICI